MTYLRLDFNWLSLCVRDLGPNEYKQAVAYVRNEFVSLNRVESKVVYVHQTCATDTDQVKIVLESCFDLIFRQAVESIGFS